MKRFIVGLIVGLILLPAAALFYLWLGLAPVATAAPPLPFERWIAKTALHARLAKDSPKVPPVPPTEANLLAGAMTYRTYCSVCHGTATGPKTAAAKGMYPPPPQLFQGQGVTDDPVGYTFWKASNGIRLTGMPGFHESLTDEQLWQISELLKNGNKLPPSVQAILAAPPSMP